MRELTIRLSALAPEAANALHVVAYFDRLVEHRAGYRSVIRGAAILSGCSIGFIDRSHGERWRVLSDGTFTTAKPASADVWPRVASGDGSLEMWLERADPIEGGLDALILERALLASATMLGRTLETPERRRAGWVRALLSDAPDDAARDTALHELDLTATTPLCVVFTGDDTPLLARSIEDARAAIGSRRAGIGPIVPARAAATSWTQARLAHLLTAEGTQQDPGDRVVLAEENSTLLALAANVRPDQAPPADVATLDAAATSAWMLPTLQAISTTNSVRDAANLLHLHHSTMQERAARADRILGWNVLSQRGKHRTQLALAMRRIITAARRSTTADHPLPIPPPPAPS